MISGDCSCICFFSGSFPDSCSFSGVCFCSSPNSASYSSSSSSNTIIESTGTSILRMISNDFSCICFFSGSSPDTCSFSGVCVTVCSSPLDSVSGFTSKVGRSKHSPSPDCWFSPGLGDVTGKRCCWCCCLFLDRVWMSRASDFVSGRPESSTYTRCFFARLLDFVMALSWIPPALPLPFWGDSSTGTWLKFSIARRRSAPWIKLWFHFMSRFQSLLRIVGFAPWSRLSIFWFSFQMRACSRWRMPSCKCLLVFRTLR